MSLTSRVVVITGATGNLGQTAARAFAAAGASLALNARTAPALDRVAAGLGLPPERVLVAPGDVRDPSVAESLAGEVMSRYGRVDVVLHLVGDFQPGAPVAEMAPSALSAMLDVNLVTTFNVARAFLPHLTANGWGRLIAISSYLAQQPAARTSGYAVAKAGMEALMLAIAQEVKGKGVTANFLVVRTIDTPEARAAAPKANVAGWTTPEEIAAAMLYLCSHEGGAVNGIRMPLYGRG